MKLPTAVRLGELPATPPPEAPPRGPADDPTPPMPDEPPHQIDDPDPAPPIQDPMPQRRKPLH